MKGKSTFSKRLLSFVVVLTMMITVLGNIDVLAEREYAADVSIMGTTVQFTNEPYREYDGIFVPLEEMCGYIGVSVSKNGDLYTMNRAGTVVEIQVGNMYAVVNGKRVDLTLSPVMRNEVFYVPMEFFSLCLDIFVETSEDMSSADLMPNVYTITIDEQHAAAVSALTPENDVLETSATGRNLLRDHMDLYPKKSSYVYYIADLSAFKDKDIKSATLEVVVKLNEYGSTVTAQRTAHWKKGEINWNNQPVAYEEKSSSFSIGQKVDAVAPLDILPLVNSALRDETELSLKILGKLRAGEKNELDKHAFSILGVNYITPPAIKITVNESYNFPIKMVGEAEDESRYSEMGILRSLGVFTDEDEFPLDFSEEVSRYEFLRYALRLANAEIVKGSSQHFSDVPADAPFFDEVNTARAQGYIAGDAGVLFRPYDSITVGEAVTVMGRILNYDVYAEERGGYTPGYFDAARIGELYMGAAVAEKPLSFNEMLKLLKNALDADILEVTTYSSNGTAEYIFNENKNILTEYWNAKVIEETVTKNEYSSLTPGESGKENTISIDSKELKLLYKEYNNFLGYRVKGWYDNDDRLLYMGIKEYDITEIDLADVTGDSVSGNTVTFTYEKANGSNASEAFSVENNKKYVIYNGKSIAAGDLGKMLLDEADGGSIKLVSDNLTVINAYRTVVVSSVDVDAEAVFDKYDLYNRRLQLKNAEYVLKNSDGSNAKIEDIKSGDVLSAAVSTDGTVADIIICREQVSGTIEMIENGDDLKIAVITVNGKEFTLANTAKPLLSNTGSKYWTDFVKLNTSATFMLDAFGSIVSVLDTQTEAIPGYIVAMGYNSGISKQLQAAVMVKTDEKYQIYEFANNVKFNGDKKKEADIKKYFHEGNNESNAFIETAVLFDVNAEGEISKIDTALNAVDPKGDVTKPPKTTTGTSADEQKLVRRYSGNGYKFKNGSNVLGNKFFWDTSDTLNIVTDGETNYEEYISWNKAWKNDDEPTITVYTIGTRTPETCIVVVTSEKPGSTVSETTPLVVVDRVVKAFDSDGLEVDKLYYWEGVGKLSSAIVADADEVTYNESFTFKWDDSSNRTTALSNAEKIPVSRLKRGDIVRVARTAEGELGGIEKVYDYEKQMFNGFMNGYDNDRFNKEPRFVGGYTHMLEDKYMCMLPAEYDGTNVSVGADTEENRHWLNLEKLPSLLRYEVSSAGVEILPATLGDIRPYETVPYDPTGFIYHVNNESPQGNAYVIGLPKPAGIGEYYVTYSSGTRPIGETSNMPGNTSTSNPYTLPVAPDGGAGWKFRAWEIDGTEYAAGASYTLTKGVTNITALWDEVVTYKVIFDGGNVRDDMEKNLELGETANLYTAEEFAKTGYKLYGWEDESGTVHAPDEEYTHSVQGTVTFKAKWLKAETAEITVDDMDLSLYYGNNTPSKLWGWGGTRQYFKYTDTPPAQWLLVRIKVGEGWSFADTEELSLDTGFYVSKEDSYTQYITPLTKAQYDAAVSGNAAFAPTSVSSADKKSGDGKAKRTLTTTLTTANYADSYEGEYLYMAIEWENVLDGIYVGLNKDGGGKENWILSLKGYKAID